MKSLPKKQPKKQPPPQKQPAEKPAVVMPLGAANYIMIALGALVIAASYGIMFLEREVDGVFALFISPVTLIGAYLWIIYAILYRPKVQKKQS